MTNDFHTLIAKSSCILDLLQIIDRAAKTDSTILITGESGVGKELFAERIHLQSHRKDGPFVRVNCASIPENLLESELFGHVKGAFTDAVKDRQGRFEKANGGSIFLDEIGDLPLPLQAKLLRVLQEKKFEKIGSSDTIDMNVRIITATNKDIEKQVQNGKFREDLYYRLNVIPVYIPPLRKRPEDIMELAEYFLKDNNVKTNKQFDGFTQEAVTALLSYSWPGNVRELQNCIERACIIAPQASAQGKNMLIDAKDMFIDMFLEANAEAKESRNLKQATDAFKAYFIQKVLKDCNGNQTEAARVLAIQRTYLSKLIKEFKIR